MCFSRVSVCVRDGVAQTAGCGLAQSANARPASRMPAPARTKESAVAPGTARSSPVRGRSPAGGGTTTPESSGAVGPDPASPTAGARKGSLPWASADAARNRVRQHAMTTAAVNVRTTPRYARPRRRGNASAIPCARRQPGRLTLPICYLSHFCIFARLFLEKKGARRARFGTVDPRTDSAPKTRRDHVDGLFSSPPRDGLRCVQKLYSAVAFGSPLLTSAEY